MAKIPEAIYRLSSRLRNCAHVVAISPTKQTHAQILVHGFLSNTTLQTDLLLAYSKCGFLVYAHKLFDQMLERNMHSWNILISSYVFSSLYSDAIGFFFEFIEMGFRPDHYTLPPLFKASAGIGNSRLGKLLHCWVIKLGFDRYLFVGSSVLDSYAKCGDVYDARRVFFNMPFRDSVIWNSMISAFGRAGFYSDSLNCFRDMLNEGVEMDYMTIPSILNACGGEGDLMKGKEIHGNVIKNLMFDSDIAIRNSLIDMYAKCGCLLESEKLFWKMDRLNLVTWTTMISSYGIHGKGEESLALFEKMIKDYGLKPNNVTLTAILASCSHAGLIGQGKLIFNSISSEFGLEPSVEHYACMVDLLGRFGYLQEALGLIHSMKLKPRASVWGALLSGCLKHKNIEIGEIAAFKLFELEPKNPSNYIALSSIYKSCDLSHGVLLARAKMQDSGLAKIPGCSWIMMRGTVYRFYQGDLSHSLALGICETLDAIIKA